MSAPIALSNRRPMLRDRVEYQGHTFFLTYGYDEQSRCREVFCAGKRETADLIATLISACILLSKYLQTGVTLDQVRDDLPDDGFVAFIVGKAITAEADRIATIAFEQVGR